MPPHDDVFTMAWALWYLTMVVRPSATLFAGFCSSWIAPMSAWLVNPLQHDGGIDTLAALAAFVFIALFASINTAYLWLFDTGVRYEILFRNASNYAWTAAVVVSTIAQLLLYLVAGLLYSAAELSELPLVRVHEWTQLRTYRHVPSLCFTAGVIVLFASVATRLDRQVLGQAFQPSDRCRSVFAGGKWLKKTEQRQKKKKDKRS